MSSSELNRRDFHRLSMAAFGGALAGSLAGCSGPTAPPAANSTATTGGKSSSPPVAGEAHEITTAEVHICRGLNTCKGKGAGGTNECAGQGDCATPSTHHDCSGSNACKGQGGCGANPAQNSCKGQGGCHVPLMAGAWKDARAFFESEMKKAGKEFGAAPAKKKAQ